MVTTATLIDGYDLRVDYNVNVKNYIRDNFPTTCSRNTPLFPDAPAAAWSDFFESQDIPPGSNITGIFDSLNDAYSQSLALDTNQVITARAIQDALIGHASLTLTRFRLIGATRTLTGTTNNAAAHPRPTTSERRTGIGGRLKTQWRAPGFTNPGTSSYFTTGRVVSAAEINLHMIGIRSEWYRIAGSTTANFELNFSVCHSSCHNQCHGSRGRR
jgi:hypothetical protein